MKNLFAITFSISLLCACHDKKNHPTACFTVTNPIMTLGDTVRIELCSVSKISRDTEWEMGDTTYSGGEIPKHVYKAKGTYTIQLTSYEHLSGKQLTHWQKGISSEAQQTVNVQ